MAQFLRKFASFLPASSGFEDLIFKTTLSSSSSSSSFQRFIVVKRYYSVRLAEVGKLEPCKVDGNYDTGQMFLHRLFGYRGVVLFPWSARVYDRDHHHPSKNRPSKSLDDHHTTYHIGAGLGKESRSKTHHTYYQVLIDDRDCPHITHRAHTETTMTFLGNRSKYSSNLCSIPGLDYVGHEDILPYVTNDKAPIHHELFDKFLMLSNDCSDGSTPRFVARDMLHAWRERHTPSLESADIHRETTENIRVTVQPFYLGSSQNQNNKTVYWWRYCIRLENLGELTVQLRERKWRIFSLTGNLDNATGRGVVSQEPILSKEQPAFQYTSHVSLQAPSGHMWGTFRMEREDGYAFDCKIPSFSLESKEEDFQPEEPTLS